MTYNIHSCRGLDGKVRPERVARVINHFDPDVVAVQEVDSHRFRSGGHDQSQLIAEHLRMSHVFHAMFEEERERYGIAIFSKFPFTIVKAAHLTGAGRRIFREARGAIWVQLEFDGRQPFHFINTHFGLGGEEKRRQADQLLGRDWLGDIPEGEPVILCGDFNSGPRSAVFRRLHQRFGDVQLEADNHKPRSTFTSLKPFMRIDHIFVSRHFTVERVELPDTPTAVMASDHLPLCAELTLRARHETS
jgi:endonuclease/exonuclease/phosphatase family metal-dependent hydrolase